jgi:hypothetical protein
MSYGAFIEAFHSVDYHTETAATPITENIPGKDGKRLALLSAEYLNAATAHTLDLMYAKDAAAYAGSARNTVNGATAAHLLSGQAIVDVDVTPRDPAGNAAASGDIVAYQLVDGTWEFNSIDSVSTKAITLAANITGIDAGAGAAALVDGAKFLIFGVTADGAKLVMSCTASVKNSWGAAAGGSGIVLAHPYVGEPFYVYDANATNAGFLNNMLFGYINK